MKFKTLSEKLSGITAKLWCRHDLVFQHNIYGDQIIFNNYNRSVWECKKCKVLVYNPQLYREKKVQLYSQDYLNKLAEEHKLITDAINRLRTDAHFNRAYGAITVQGAIGNLMTKRIELEAQIEVLTDHLN